jgi:hypothetical protein
MFFSSSKLAANRPNAQKSRGPATNAGKAASATDSRKQRAAPGLLKRQKERRSAERGFVSQKHAEAEENRTAKIHIYKVSAAKARAEREILPTERRKTRSNAPIRP